MSTMKKLRVLCLHGFRTNDKVMMNQTRALRQALGDKAEFMFVNGPFEAQGPTDASIERAHGKDAPFYEWCQIQRADRDVHEDVVDLTSTDVEWRFRSIGFDRAVECMHEQLTQHGPFDVVLGFSQGAVMLTAFSKLYLESDIRWWNLCICVGGIPVRDVSMRSHFEHPNGDPVLLPFPSIHIMGTNDPLYTESIKLAAMYEERPANAAFPKVVIEHDGGHGFPSAKRNPGLYDRLADLITRQCGAQRTTHLQDTAMPQKKLRVLCLHGFRTNVDVMRTQTQGVRDALGDRAEFVFVNAPFQSRGDTDEVIKRKYGEDAVFYEWWQVRYLEKEELEDLAAQPNPADTSIWNLSFEDIELAIEYMDEQIQKLGPFDIAMGFSQGSIMLTLLSMLYLKKQNVRPWKLCICVCGVRVHGINVRDLFETEEGEQVSVPYPSIHILGKLDTLYEDSQQLADMYEDHPKGSPMRKVILETNSGHKFPTPSRHKELYDKLAQTIVQFFEDTTRSSVARL
ncbi:D-3-phosphoglycerate dehydrogenase, partial [Globisporangium splendens]